MQFIVNGPDIPDSLLQAHEEGKVVFFCGSGISCPAGLPDFKGLVDAIYKSRGTVRTEIEDAAYQEKRFDVTLDLLERRLPGSRIAVREALLEELQLKPDHEGKLSTHLALLGLARNATGETHLVTTNFDRLFDLAAKKMDRQINTYSAPMLPIPKNRRWDGVAYLHGVLPANRDVSALQRLVLTSGDFGMAYLTERWASRFMTEMFRKYVICFVGYSINDFVLRYMMDAMAADRMLGEKSPQAYAIASLDSEETEMWAAKWEAKGVTPIPYSPDGGHHAMHETLKGWAATFRDGILGKEKLVAACGLAAPSASTNQDDFVGRLLWAISDPSGLPAKKFAELDPPPPLEWLQVFFENRFGPEHSARFGVSLDSGYQNPIRFSLVRRPAPWHMSADMALVSDGESSTSIDRVMSEVGRWLLRHLNDPSLIIMVAKAGGQIDKTWSRQIENKISRLDVVDVDAPTLDSATPEERCDILCDSMRILWRLVLTRRLKSSGSNMEPYGWFKRYKSYGLTASIRQELRDILAPRVVIRESYTRRLLGGNSNEHPSINELVRWEVELKADHVQYVVGELEKDVAWKSDSKLAIEVFEQLLLDTLDLMQELGEAGGRSHWHVPSIEQHGQNAYKQKWTILVGLTRAAWMSLHDTEEARALSKSGMWFMMPHAMFKRLALFGESHRKGEHDGWLGWILADGSKLLWSNEMRREVLRLFVLRGCSLSSVACKKLQRVILEGPSTLPSDFGGDVGRQKGHIDYSVWLYLSKLSQGKVVLDSDAVDRLSSLAKQHPDWVLAADDRDEFPNWIDVNHGLVREKAYSDDTVPLDPESLANWILNVGDDDVGHDIKGEIWQEACRLNDFECLSALAKIAEGGSWPKQFWNNALRVWGGSDANLELRKVLIPVLAKFSDEALFKVREGAAYWLKSVSEIRDEQSGDLIVLCDRMLNQEGGVVDSQAGILSAAINHPAGQVAEFLVNNWLGGELNDGDGLDLKFRPIFTKICKRENSQLHLARAIVASRLTVFFRVDPEWTIEYLVPLFDWTEDAEEAGGVWEGFLWSPRLHYPLLSEIKTYFLETASHLEQLGGMSRQYIALLTYVAIESGGIFEDDELRDAFSELSGDSLSEAARVVVEAVNDSGDQREEYWRNRIEPFWHKAWPKTNEAGSGRFAETLGHLIIASGDEMQSSFELLKHWLRPIEYPGIVTRCLRESKLAKRFPDTALAFLDALVGKPVFQVDGLRECLVEIVSVEPEFKQDPRWQHLDQLCRVFGV